MVPVESFLLNTSTIDKLVCELTEETVTALSKSSLPRDSSPKTTKVSLG